MRSTRLCGLIGVALLATLVFEGCSYMPFGSSSDEAHVAVKTSPSNAIVYVRARTEESQHMVGAEYWAVGTTPFTGDLEMGFWDMRVEVPGYEAVEVLLRAVPGNTLYYDLRLIPLEGCEIPIANRASQGKQPSKGSRTRYASR